MSLYYAMKFIPTEFNNNVTVRSIKTSPYTSLEAAIKAVKRVGQGYVHEAGKRQPVYYKLQ